MAALATPRAALLNMAPIPVNMAVCAMQHQPLRRSGFPCSQSCIWPSWCGLNRQIAYQLRNMANSAQTAESIPAGHKKKGRKYFWRKSAIFQSLMRWTARRYVFFTLGPIPSPKACLATCGRFTPLPHAYRENKPIFQSSGFPCSPSWIMCRWSPQYR